MRKLILPLVTALACATGCYTSGDYGETYAVGYSAPAPSMYYYGPGVSVVAYTDDPVFYSDGMYWRYYGDTWYSSSYYNGGWGVAYNVPYGVRSINRPSSYAHFTPGTGWTRVNAGYAGNGYARDHRTYSPPPAYSGGYGRDHRTYTPTYSPPRGGGGGPIIRDHRHH